MLKRLRILVENLSGLGELPDMPLYERRQIRLLNQVSVLILVLATIDLLVNMVQQRFTLIIGDLLLIPIMAVLPLLTSRGHGTLARFLFSLTLQLTVLLSILLEWEHITIGIYLQHLIYLIVASLVPVVFVNPWKEPWEYWLMFTIHAIIIVFVVGLPFVNVFFRPVRIPDGDFDLILMAVAFAWIMLMFMGWFFKRGYWIYNEKMEEYRSATTSSQDQIDELSEKNARLERELRKHKTQLSQRVNERTRTLEADNQRLREYAFINASLVRAPLARIKGLSHLLEVDEPNKADTSEAIHRLTEAAEELEGQLTRIKKLINDE